MTKTAALHPLLADLQSRLVTLWDRTGDPELLALSRGETQFEGAGMATEEQCNNLLSTALMSAYRDTRDTEVFALLYELNHDLFRRRIHGFLRRDRGRVDAHDVLQEVFLNICRYPQAFVAHRADAFHGWAHRIVRNTTMQCLRIASGQPTELIIDEEHTEPQDTRVKAPERIASDRETAPLVSQSYVLFLGLYMVHFRELSSREQKILTLAEVERLRYRDIGTEFGIPVMSVKMTVFRCRRRILRGMTESLAALARMEFTVGPVHCP